ncbi:hypothetical protein [Pontibacter beigongshangensis]|uniref:hypothetical protein n=1 Tax=Pontibacter beigongshangensis TaxID=2574733 RepID=UPI00164EF5CA|nr:hypothetical protein [Pontibacter beigongshangensis]
MNLLLWKGGKQNDKIVLCIRCDKDIDLLTVISILWRGSPGTFFYITGAQMKRFVKHPGQHYSNENDPPEAGSSAAAQCCNEVNKVLTPSEA